jgi:hypothetical protein
MAPSSAWTTDTVSPLNIDIVVYNCCAYSLLLVKRMRRFRPLLKRNDWPVYGPRTPSCTWWKERDTPVRAAVAWIWPHCCAFAFPNCDPRAGPHSPWTKKASNPFWFWQPQKTPPVTTSKVHRDNRTAMKPVALNGKGAYFGMEPRYDNAKIGLSPLRYWSKPYY